MGDFDEFEDLDSLLELESQLIEDGGDSAGHKRARADLQSQQEAARSLAGAWDAGGGGQAGAELAFGLSPCTLLRLYGPHLCPPDCCTRCNCTTSGWLQGRPMASAPRWRHLHPPPPPPLLLL